MGDATGAVPPGPNVLPPGPRRRRSRRGRWLRAIGIALALAGTGFVGLTCWALLLSGRADRAHREGQHAEAVRLYARARRMRVLPLGHSEVEDRIGRCVGEIGDPAEAVAVATAVLDVADTTSFGMYDYLVARAVANPTTRMFAVNLANPIERFLGRDRYGAAFEDVPRLELALARIRIFLDGPGGSPEERKAAESLREMILVKLSPETGVYPADFVPPSTPGPVLPTGKIDDLRKVSREPDRPWFERGKAAFAAGQGLEKAGDKPAALAAYRDAFELIRKVLPFYQHPDEDRYSGTWDDMKVLDEVVAAIARLDTSQPVTPKGGLRFHTDGIPLPAGMEIYVAPVLVDASLPATGHTVKGSNGSYLHRDVRIRTDQKPWIGVVDGRYRLSASLLGMSLQGDASGAFPDRLLYVDFSPWPAEVEVRGRPVDLAIRIYRREAMRQLDPPDNAPIDLRKAVFRWTPVPGAAYYEVSFSITERRMMTFFAGFRVPSTSLTLTDGLPEWKDNVENLRRYLKAGATAEWHVRARDARGLDIGTVLEEPRHFLVARPLEGAP